MVEIKSKIVCFVLEKKKVEKILVKVIPVVLL